MVYSHELGRLLWVSCFQLIVQITECVLLWFLLLGIVWVHLQSFPLVIVPSAKRNAELNNDWNVIGMDGMEIPFHMITFWEIGKPKRTEHYASITDCPSSMLTFSLLQ